MELKVEPLQPFRREGSGRADSNAANSDWTSQAAMTRPGNFPRAAQGFSGTLWRFPGTCLWAKRKARKQSACGWVQWPKTTTSRLNKARAKRTRASETRGTGLTPCLPLATHWPITKMVSSLVKMVVAAKCEGDVAVGRTNADDLADGVQLRW